jgi:hypothetical protein
MQSEKTTGIPAAPAGNGSNAPPHTDVDDMSQPGKPIAPNAPMPEVPAPRGWFRWVWPILVLAALLAGGGWLLANHDLASDWLVTRGYKPPVDIQKLASDSTMTAYGRRLFYVNKPKVEGRDAFNRDCAHNFDEVSVLGCFRGDRQGIYIYNITEKELAGIQQVTAAHEMLHQAYERLDTKEKKRIDALLNAYAETVANPEMLSKMQTYQETEPNDLLTEYHSIFGTEARGLPKELEDYYKQYFEKRETVVALAEHYQAAFTERTKKIQAYDSQLDSLKKKIEENKAKITSDEAALKARRADMDAMLSSNQIAQYNAVVAGFNRQVADYKALISSTNATIVRYNQIIEDRNAIAVEEQKLQQAIDSHTSPASAQ